MKVVIIHGNGGGTRDDNWQPWLETELTKLGVKVINRTMPDNVEAKASAWLPFMEKDLGIDQNTVIVGHSSGAVAAMRYAETHHIKGSVLIGACYTDLDDASEKASGYYDAPWQWDKIKAHQEFIVVMASNDDPWIPLVEPRHISKSLAAEYHAFADKGHFLAEHMNGKKEFPELLLILKKHLQKP